MQLRVPLLCGATGLPVRHAIQVLETTFEANEPRNNSSKMKLKRIKSSTVRCGVDYARTVY